LTVLAHAADWISLVFLVPALGFLVWLAVAQVRQRREDRRADGG